MALSKKLARTTKSVTVVDPAAADVQAAAGRLQFGRVGAGSDPGSGREWLSPKNVKICSNKPNIGFLNCENKETVS